MRAALLMSANASQKGRAVGNQTHAKHWGALVQKRILLVFLCASIACVLATPASAGKFLLATPCYNPNPKSVVGKCNKEAGGACHGHTWFVGESQVAAKNACVSRMLKGKQ